MVSSTISILVAACAIVAAPQTASACSVTKEVFHLDKRIISGPDCSFENGGAYDNVTAKAAMDIGGGKVAQTLVSHEFCGAYEDLLVVDCQTRNVVWIEGQSFPDSVSYGGPAETKVAALLRPHGPIRLNEKTTVEGLIEVSSANKLNYVAGLDALFHKVKRKNRYDPFCGCKLFYPDLAEVTQ